jgi:hypothetical protein
MSFSNQERINLNSKALQAGVLDGNAAAAWYETTFPFTFMLDGNLVLNQMAQVRALPASNLTTARSNASSNPTLIQDLSQNTSAIRLTLVPGTNQTTYAAFSTYGNLSSARVNKWLMPQFAPQSNGLPSVGYAVRLFDGDPGSGGTEIGTTAGSSGTGVNKSVGWIFNYAAGLLLLASDFFSSTGINAGLFDPHILGFRYIGSTAASVTPGATPFQNLDEFESTSGQTQFSLSGTPDTSKLAHLVYINGRAMRYGVDYTFSGSTMNMSWTPSTDSFIAVYYNT